MKTLLIKLTEEQRREVRKLLQVPESDSCEYLGIKLPEGAEQKLQPGLSEPILLYMPPPDDPIKTMAAII
jgi:hypothetical protein